MDKKRCLKQGYFKHGPGYGEDHGTRCSCLTAGGSVRSLPRATPICQRMRKPGTMPKVDRQVAKTIYDRCGSLPGFNDFKAFKLKCQRKNTRAGITVTLPFSEGKQWKWLNVRKK